MPTVNTKVYLICIYLLFLTFFNLDCLFPRWKNLSSNVAAQKPLLDSDGYRFDEQ